MGLEVFTIKLVLIAVFVERGVAQLKKLAKLDTSKPWPLVAFGLSLVITYNWQLYSITAVIGHGPTTPIPIIGVSGFMDCLISALVLSGGSAFVVDTFKQAGQRRQQMHEAKVGATRDPQPGPGV